MTGCQHSHCCLGGLCFLRLSIQGRVPHAKGMRVEAVFFCAGVVYGAERLCFVCSEKVI